MVRADARAALTVADREVRVASVVDKVVRAVSAVARADREALDLAQAEWAEQLRFLR
jgi:hypothetical protein